MRIALISLDQDWLDKDANLAKSKKYIEKSANENCDIVIFPEMTLTGFSPKHKIIVEDLEDSNTLNNFGKLSKKYNIDIIFGACLLKKSLKKPFNMVCLSKSSGESRALYAKTHLFSYANEDRYILPGDEIVTHKIRSMEFGFGVCYDLRFPELFSIMSKNCKAIIIIANWPESRDDHWRTLLKARAIENQCVIIGVNRTGIDGNGIAYKSNSSLVFTPNGSLLNPIKSDSLFDIYDIYEEQVDKYRSSFPTIKDKLPKFYKLNL